MSAVKHQPATPLPWTSEERGHTIHRYVVRVGARKVCDVTRHNGQREDADYLAHAANAYPKLIDRLKGALQHFDALETRNRSEDVHRARIAELLSELGEAS